MHVNVVHKKGKTFLVCCTVGSGAEWEDSRGAWGRQGGTLTNANALVVPVQLSVIKVPPKWDSGMQINVVLLARLPNTQSPSCQLTAARHHGTI